MRLLRAELIKLRHRWATYVVLAVLLGLMALVFVLVGFGSRGGGAGGSSFVRFPGAYGVINQFVFGLGSLLAVAFAAAIAGADWSWGVLRVFIARGESRAWYVIAKAVALGLVFLLGVIIAFAVGILLVFVAAGLAGIDPRNPLSRQGAGDLLESFALGFPVLVQRAAIGFAVAVILRSQLAGVIAGILLYIGEAILSLILITTTFAGRFGAFDPDGGMPQSIGPEWFQYLPFSIGDSVLAAAPGVGPDLESAFLVSVPLGIALAVTGLYLLVALALSALSVERAEITA
jgi:hypothetical protein